MSNSLKHIALYTLFCASALATTAQTIGQGKNKIKLPDVDNTKSTLAIQTSTGMATYTGRDAQGNVLYIETTNRAGAGNIVIYNQNGAETIVLGKKRKILSPDNATPDTPTLFTANANRIDDPLADKCDDECIEVDNCTDNNQQIPDGCDEQTPLIVNQNMGIPGALTLRNN